MARKTASKKSQREIVEKPIEIKPNFALDFKVNNEFELLPQHKVLVDALLKKSTHMVWVDGYAGTCKTYCAMLAGLILLSKKNMDKLVYTRSIAESAMFRMGSLPGEVNDKFAPWIGPLNDKLNELLPVDKSKALINEGFVECVPVNYMRGLTFHNSYVIIDEAQNMTFNELVTVLTRFGNNSKYVIIGDSHQSDINGKSGFRKLFDAFNCEECLNENIYAYKFGTESIVRSEILKFIVDRIESAKFSSK